MLELRLADWMVWIEWFGWWEILTFCQAGPCRCSSPTCTFISTFCWEHVTRSMLEVQYKRSKLKSLSASFGQPRFLPLFALSQNLWWAGTNKNLIGRVCGGSLDTPWQSCLQMEERSWDISNWFSSPVLLKPACSSCWPNIWPDEYILKGVCYLVPIKKNIYIHLQKQLQKDVVKFKRQIDINLNRVEVYKNSSPSNT